jgi:hypothetical protein
MDADPQSGAAVYTGSGPPSAVGGTSLSAPLALGVWARLQTLYKSRLGFAAPLLYGAYRTSGFHDISLGNSGPYSATPGWDYATGLGSFDVGQMRFDAVASMPVSLPTPTCMTNSDPYGDSHPLASVANVDALDIRAVGFRADGDTITAQLAVQRLDGGPGGLPQLAGGGDIWFVEFGYGGVTWWLEARFPGRSADPNNPALLVDYVYGYIDTSAPTRRFTAIGPATGRFDLAGGVITLSAPRGGFTTKLNGTSVGVPVGATLTPTGAESFELVGALGAGALEAADTTSGGTSYTLGKSC